MLRRTPLFPIGIVLVTLLLTVITALTGRTGVMAAGGGPMAEATAPPSDLVVEGRVYNAALGPGHGIAGATVWVCTVVPRCYPATTDQDGHYELLVPGIYATSINRLAASAPGYAPWEEAVTWSELAAQPHRDLGLTPLAPGVWLPLALGAVDPAAPPTMTPTVTETHTPTPTASPTVTPTETEAVVPCPCTGNVRNCSDFATQRQAQACYDHCWTPTTPDIHNLDSDDDGIACETLP